MQSINEQIDYNIRELEKNKRLAQYIQTESVFRKISVLNEQIDYKIDYLIELKTDIIQQIESIDNYEEQEVLRLRYLCYEKYPTWEDIADHMKYTERQIYNIHGSALLKIKVPEG